jgi:hypothetical protein
LIKLRNQYAPFRSDRLIWLSNSEENSLVTLMRLDEKDEFVIVINFSNRPLNAAVKVLNAPDFKLIFPVAGNPPTGFPSVSLKGFEYRIYHRQVAK